jgi:CHAT domain-containing protein
MDPRKAVEDSRAKIDMWIKVKPPPAHFPHHYTLPERIEDTPEIIKKFLGPAEDFFRENNLREFFAAFPRDCQIIDAACFQDQVEELLIKPIESLYPIIINAPPDLACESLISAAYGMLQLYLWHDQVNIQPVPGPEALQVAGGIAQRAKSALGRAGKSQDDWLDTIIRVEIVLGWTQLRAGDIDQAIGHFLYLVGWYMAAEELGYQEVVHKRYDDWLHALYAIVDMGHAPRHQAWISTAAALLKNLRIGQRHINPFRIEPVPRTSIGSTLDLHLQTAFVDQEWQRGVQRLGDKSGFVDIIATDWFIHARFTRRGENLSFKSPLPQVNRPAPPGERPRGTYPLNSTSSLLEPVVKSPDGKNKGHELTELVSEWHPTGHTSKRVRWVSWFQTAKVHQEGTRWTWNFNWKANIPTFEEELWRVVYATVFAKVIKAAEAAGINHLIISPDGSLTAMPHHLVRDPAGRRLGDRFLVSYAPNLNGLLTILDADELPKNGINAFLIEDPRGSASLAEWECEKSAAIIGAAARVIARKDATSDRIKAICVGATILHFTGHAVFNWPKPEDSYLQLGGDGRLTLSDLQSLKLRPGALVFLSACDTGRRTISGKRSNSRGIVSALFEAGAATVICTLWPVHSIAAALVSTWFYENWIGQGKGRLESLQEAIQRLREASYSECEQAIGERFYMNGEKPFEDEYYWGAFVLYGAW